MFKLPKGLKQMGAMPGCKHRSGWPHVMEELQSRESEDGVLLDDFVERTFQQTKRPPVWHEPWIGVFHHPQNVPQWFESAAALENILNRREFKSSRATLVGGIALTQYLGDWLSNRLDIEVMVAKHPTEIPDKTWRPGGFLSGTPRLVQVGWWLRNLRGIHQVAVPEGWEKVHLHVNKPWVDRALFRTDRHSPYKERPVIGDTKVCKDHLSNDEYDNMLSRSVVFMEVFETSANNAVVECIARNTPIVANRHPAIVEHLGENYPLLFDDISEVPRLLEDDKVMEAHAYLTHMDKTFLSRDVFCDQIEEFVRRISEE